MNLILQSIFRNHMENIREKVNKTVECSFVKEIFGSKFHFSKDLRVWVFAHKLKN